MKAKNMTMKDAVPYLEKMLKKTSGKKKRRALQLALASLNRPSDITPAKKNRYKPARKFRSLAPATPIAKRHAS